MKETEIRNHREKMLSDPYRPGYHFAIFDGNGNPGDPNGAFFADGRYHLMYLYYRAETDSYNWGHLSSIDLLHWRNHPDAIGGYKGDRGCNSGGGFVDDDDIAYISFWKFPAKNYNPDNGGLAIAYAKPPYDEWKRIEPIAVNGSRKWGVADIEINGETEHISCADPSNIWKENGYYYMLAGNYHVMHWYGRKEGTPEKYNQDWTDLFKSKDMIHWEYQHRFYKNPHLGENWPDKTEDNMCPCFVRLPNKKSNGKLTDKYLQIFLSHNRGCQYYIGNLENEIFYPEQHGRMSWKDNSFGPPETLTDDKNRCIMWAWLCDNYCEDEFDKFGWSGVFSFPRLLWYEDDVLHMAPAEELDMLQYNPQNLDVNVVSGEKMLDIKNGNSFRLKTEIDMKSATQAGFKVKINSDEDEDYTEIYYDKTKSQLIFRSNKPNASTLGHEEIAPFSLKNGENLCVDLFVDKSVLEIYVNERQAICRRIYSKYPKKSLGVSAISDGADFKTIHVYEMMPTNPY